MRASINAPIGSKQPVINPLVTDVVNEETADNGVMIEGVKLKDSQVYVDIINEKTADTGVTLDGVVLRNNRVHVDSIRENTVDAGVAIEYVLLKDGQVSTDVINELTPDSGVTIDGCLIKDGKPGVNTCRIKTGLYTGDGTANQGISGVGFQPLGVFVSSQADVGTASGYLKISGHTDPLSLNIATGILVTRRLISLDADGFSVDDKELDAHPNKDGHSYIYLVWG